MNTPVRVFCSYSSEDEELYRQFEVVLGSLKWQGVVSEWHGCVIPPEMGWQGTVDQRLEGVELIVPLLSASSISSGCCSRQEMSQALAQHDASEALVLPLIGRPCIWQATPLGRLNVLPKEGKAVTSWPNRDEAWTHIAEGIRQAADTPLLRPFYRELCAEGRKALLTGKVHIAPFLDDLSKDKRMGLTLIVRPSQEVATQLLAINAQLKQVGPQHFYYDRPRFHFTILSLVNAVAPPKVSQALASRFVQPIDEVLSGFPPFEVEFLGVCPTTGSFIVKGFPVGDGLENLRSALRRRLREVGLGDGVDERYRVQGAHVTMGRFKVSEGLSSLVEVFDQLCDQPLGRMRVQQAQLVLNDFHMSPDKVQIVAEFPIGQVDRRPAPPSMEPDESAGITEEPQPAKPPTNGEPPQPTFGIVTALPKEYAAVKVVLENQRDYFVSAGRIIWRYLLGEVPGFQGTKHSVALAMAADMGNNMAAARATLLLQHFPSVESIIMVGIAGGIPHPEKPAEHVRLGDVVASDRGGVVQYDFDKETADVTIHRHPPRPPSAGLLQGVRFLQVAEIEGNRPWQAIAQRVLKRLNITRPPEETDILASSADPEVIVPHPQDPQREKEHPRIFMGPIASANKLLKNPVKRDALRDRFGVRAVEMEGSGIADATWQHGVGYLVVRGVCDYCDMNKGDAWQEYAAAVAAAYTGALLQSMPGQISDIPKPESPPTPQPTPPTPPSRVLHNLYMRRTDVVGRQKEHQHVLESLSQADKPVILASGYGGIGKSTLAKMVAWTCLDRREPFDFIAWLNVRQYSEAQTLSLNYILDAIAKIADSNSDIPKISHPETKQDRVRELLKGHRSLLILDNYESLLTDPDEEQKVSAFLDSLPAGSMRDGEGTCIRVLITTREVSRGLRALPIDELRLQRLSLEDSVKLMKSRVPGLVRLTDDQYKRIWEMLHGLPKYIEIAIEQLRSTNFEQWERITMDITVPLDEREEFFNDLFKHSWARFHEDFRRILMSLTYFVGGAPSKALQVTSGLSERVFVRVLGTASDAYIESTGTGYTAHPLTHAFCQAVLNSAETAEFRQESGRRFVGYYSEFAKNAHANRRTDLLEQEIRNIVAAVKLAKESKRWDDLIELRGSVAGFMRFRGYWHELIEILFEAVEAFRELRKERMLAECLVHDLVWYLLRLEDLETADRYAKEGLVLFEKLGDRQGVAQGKRHLGKSALVKGLDPRYEPSELWPEHSPTAERYYRESLQIREELAKEGLDQRWRIADMKLDFGRLYWLQGKWYERDGRRRKDQAYIEGALRKYVEANSVGWEAMSIFEELQNKRGIAKTWGNLGNATKEMVRFMLAEGRLTEAAERIAETHDYYERSLKIAEQIRRRDEIAHAQWGLAEVYELYADYPDLHNRAGDRRILLETALRFAEESHWRYTFLGGAKDIKATERLVDRIKGKLSRF